MISFSEHPSAYGDWAKSHVSPIEGLKILAQPLRDGSWKRAPEAWVQCLRWHGFWTPASTAQALALRAELVKTILGGSLDDSAHAALPGLFELYAEQAPPTDAEAITTWLLQSLEPNDGALVGDLVYTFVYSSNDPLLASCFPLVGWLLSHGSSELRSAQRSRLVAALLPVVLRFGTDDQLTAAIRYVLYNEERVGSNGWGAQTMTLLCRDRDLARLGYRVLRLPEALVIAQPLRALALVAAAL